MRKKILYGILLLTLFMVSTVSMIQPVYAYEFGVPDEAIDVVGESEIKIYNEDEWEESIGKDGAKPDDIYYGDADVVGARQMTILRDLGAVEKTGGPDDHEFEDGLPAVERVFKISPLAENIDESLVPGVTGLAGPAGIVAQITNATLGGGASGAVALGMAGAFAAGIKDYDDLMAIYAEEWDGWIMWRDKWFYNKDWETDEDYGDPDKADLEADDKWTGWGPVFADPRDFRELVDILGAIQNQILADLDAIRGPILDTYMQFFQGGPVAGWPGTAMDKVAQYDALNATLAAPQAALGGATLLQALGFPVIPKNWSIVHGGSDMANGDYVYSFFNFLDIALGSMWHIMDKLAPFRDKLAMLIGLAAASNLPVGSPSGDWMARALKEFNFDDDVLYQVPLFAAGKDLNGDGAISNIAINTLNNFMFPLGGEKIYIDCYADVSIEGQVVTIEIEWPDDTIDPADSLKWKTAILATGPVAADHWGEGEDELKDFELIITYSDLGTCACTWVRGDTILWQAGGVDQIPGYEITILLGVSGISVLALVYIIMKKRRK